MVNVCKILGKIAVLYYPSGVFSTGATGAIAPVILRKRLIAPVIFHLPYSVIIFRECIRAGQILLIVN